MELALAATKHGLQDDNGLGGRTSLNIDDVMRLLELCLSATYMSFQGSMFQQTYGTAMGSPVSVTVANLVMEDVEERALATTKMPPRFWKWYVDDTCTVLPLHKVNDFLHHLNKAELSIQFTVEVEVHGRFPLLDVLLEHRGSMDQ